MKTFEFIDTQVNSKFGDYTHWVNLDTELEQTAFKRLGRNKGHHSSLESRANYSQKLA
jgi:hypothetical protein